MSIQVQNAKIQTQDLKTFSNSGRHQNTIEDFLNLEDIKTHLEDLKTFSKSGRLADFLKHDVLIIQRQSKYY